MVVPPSEVGTRRAPAQLVAVVVATFALILGPLGFVPAHAVGAGVSGVVTNENNEAVEDATVTLAIFNPDTTSFDDVSETSTDEEGGYSFDDLTVGKTYRVAVAEGDPYAASTPVDFEMGSARTADFVVSLAGSIGGLVKEAANSGPSSNQPLGGVAVLVYPIIGVTVDVDNPVEVTSEEDGTYLVGGLTAGSYKVRYEDFDANHLPTYYKNSSTLAGAATVVVAKGADVALDNVNLQVGSQFTGSVVDAAGDPIVDASVQALPLVRGEADYDNAVDAVIQENGDYTISGLSAGPYKVQFSGDPDVHLDEFYNNQPTEETAEVLNLGTAANRALGRTILEGPAGLTGVVKNKTKKIGGITVEVFKVNGSVLAKTATDETYTEDDGTFAVEDLLAGTYRLKLTDDEGRFRSRFSADITAVGGTVKSVGVIELTEVPKKAATLKVVGKGGKKKVTLTITVKATGVTPTGKVTVRLGSKALKTVNLKKGKATVTLTKQKKGKRAYKVTYSGDAKVLTKSVTSKKITIK